MEKKLKILMIAPTPFFEDRGVHVQIYEEAKALKKMGHRVVIVTYPLGRDLPDMEIYRTIKIPGLHKLKIGPSWIKPFLLDPLLFFKSLVVAIKIKPDVIHGHLHEGCLIGYPLKIILRRPLIFDLQGSLTGELRAHRFIAGGGLLFELFYFAEKVINKIPDAIVTQSTQMLEELKTRFNVPAEKAFLNYDGVDTDVFRPMPKDKNLAASLKLPENKRVAVYLGIFSEYQGVDLLLRAISLLPWDSNLYFLIMGGPDVKKYQDAANDLNIADKITFTGYVDYKKAPQYLALGDCAISLKFDDTEANGKLYNYLAMGLPIVATPSRVNKEILSNVGIFTPDYSPENVSRVLNNISFLSAGELQEIGRRGREYVLNKYSWDAGAGRLSDIYRRFKK